MDEKLARVLEFENHAWERKRALAELRWQRERDEQARMMRQVAADDLYISALLCEIDDARHMG